MTVQNEENRLKPYVSTLSAWALSIGTSIGWGSFVLTGTNYLLKAGPLGSFFGMIIGFGVMMVIAYNYHFMMQRERNAGGAYTFTKNTFGFDYGFLTAWFLGLTYISIFWANITSLPLFSRYFFGDVLSFGFSYTVFGYKVSMGEILICLIAIVFTGLACAYAKRMVAHFMVVMSLAFVIALAIPFIVSFVIGGGTITLKPGYVPDRSEVIQIIRIACISPWAFIGFENISNSGEELDFPHRNIMKIFAVSLIATTALYVMVILLSITAYPAPYTSWLEYLRDLDNLTGLEALPSFYAAHYYLGEIGVFFLIVALLALVLTSFAGNMIALSRLIYAVARDEMLPARFAVKNKKDTPANAIWLVVALSVLIPFLGRTAIGWIVDVTTLGAILIYGVVSATTIVRARAENAHGAKVTGILGVIFMTMLLVFWIATSDSLAMESHFFFAIWAVLGIFLFRIVLLRDTKARRFGKTGIVWIVLLALVLFTAIEWLEFFSERLTEATTKRIIAYYGLAEGSVVRGIASEEFLRDQMDKLRMVNTMATAMVVAIFGLSILIIINNHALMRKREKEREKELGEAVNVANTDPLTGVKSKHAFSEAEKKYDLAIDAGTAEPFAVVVCDINGLKHINDTYGHKAGDELICKASEIICRLFKRSPVYRIGGDEFVVIMTGADYEARSEIMAELNRRVEENKASGGVVVASGISDYESEDFSFKEAFERADARMYTRKKQLKE